MGKQTRFVHVEEDIYDFLSFLEGEGGYILWDGRAVKPLSLEREIVERMGSWRCQYQITACSEVGIDEKKCSTIEFTSSSKGNSLSRTYEPGRIYLARTEEGIYDERLLALFAKLHGYIRKSYSYSAKATIYYSGTFKKQYDRQYYYVTQAGWRITL